MTPLTILHVKLDKGEFKYSKLELEAVIGLGDVTRAIASSTLLHVYGVSSEQCSTVTPKFCTTVGFL